MRKKSVILMGCVVLAISVIALVFWKESSTKTPLDGTRIDPGVGMPHTRDPEVCKIPSAKMEVVACDTNKGSKVVIAPLEASRSQVVESSSIKVGGVTLPVRFENADIQPALAEAITADIELLLSFADNVRWMERKHPIEGRGTTVTHDLLNWRTGELPDVFKNCFGGAGVIIDGKPQLFIIQELIDAYEVAWKRKQCNPFMFERIEEFLTLLANREMLEKLADDQEKSQAFFYSYKERIPSAEKIRLGIIQYADMQIRSPSILDVQPLGEIFNDPEYNDAIYALSAVLEHPDYPTESVRMPLGAYVDGEWKILCYPMP